MNRVVRPYHQIGAIFLLLSLGCSSDLKSIRTGEAGATGADVENGPSEKKPLIPVSASSEGSSSAKESTQGAQQSDKKPIANNSESSSPSNVSAQIDSDAAGQPFSISGSALGAVPQEAIYSFAPVNEGVVQIECGEHQIESSKPLVIYGIFCWLINNPTNSELNPTIYVIDPSTYHWNITLTSCAGAKLEGAKAKQEPEVPNAVYPATRVLIQKDQVQNCFNDKAMLTFTIDRKDTKQKVSYSAAMTEVMP